MSELIVITGPPGAGKSTVARLLAEEYEPSALVAGDEFFAFVRRGRIDPWLAEAHAQNGTVTAAGAAAAGQLASGGYTVVYDGVLGPWFLDVFIARSGLESIQYAVLLPSQDLCVERVRARVEHGFNDLQAARHMWEEFAGADLERRHIVPVDPDDDAENTLATVRTSLDNDLFRYRPGKRQAC